MDNKDVHIEKINITNLNDLETISKKTFFESYSIQNQEEDMNNYLSVNFSSENLSKELNNPNSEFYFAKINDQLVGYLKLNSGTAQTEADNQDGIEIQRIYILKEYHGKKIGQLLLNRALKVSKDKKARYIWLGVWKKNDRAILFYEKNGFEAYDNHIFTFGNDEQFDIMMKLKL